MGKRNSKVVIGASQRVTGDIATVGKFRTKSVSQIWPDARKIQKLHQVN